MDLDLNLSAVSYVVIVQSCQLYVGGSFDFSVILVGLLSLFGQGLRLGLDIWNLKYFMILLNSSEV